MASLFKRKRPQPVPMVRRDHSHAPVAPVVVESTKQRLWALVAGVVIGLLVAWAL